MEKHKKIKIADDFSSTPGPRYEKEGDFSGELFRKKILLPLVKKAILEKEKLEVDLDGTAGYGTSFLEESSGGLIREENLQYDNVINCIQLISFEKIYLIEDIKNYLLDTKNKKKKNKLKLILFFSNILIRFSYWKTFQFTLF